MSIQRIMKSRTSQIILSNLLLILGIAGSIAFLYYWDGIRRLSGYGYFFIFLMSFVAGSPLPVPDPYMVVVFTMAPILNPLLVGLVSALGVALGQTVSFLMGRLGSSSFVWTGAAATGNSRISRWINRMVEWTKKRSTIAVFLLSAMFNPVFTPFAITMGALHFQLLKFFVMCLLGNVLKSLIIAYSGYFGLGTLLRWLGMIK